MGELRETPATELGSMIVRTPNVLAGKPHIRGHQVGVHRVAGWWKLGRSIDEIGEELSTLTSAEIFAALAYYHLNKAEIDSYLEEERAQAKAVTMQLEPGPRFASDRQSRKKGQN